MQGTRLPLARPHKVDPSQPGRVGRDQRKSTISAFTLTKTYRPILHIKRKAIATGVSASPIRCSRVRVTCGYYSKGVPRRRTPRTSHRPAPTRRRRPPPPPARQPALPKSNQWIVPFLFSGSARGWHVVQAAGGQVERLRIKKHQPIPFDVIPDRDLLTTQPISQKAPLAPSRTGRRSTPRCRPFQHLPSSLIDPASLLARLWPVRGPHRQGSTHLREKRKRRSTTAVPSAPSSSVSTVRRAGSAS